MLWRDKKHRRERETACRKRPRCGFAAVISIREKGCDSLFHVPRNGSGTRRAMEAHVRAFELSQALAALCRSQGVEPSCDKTTQSSPRGIS
eukprot:scaffold1700_cov259-Pinguiococcus_pyrenoidosus.AAC.7